MKFLATVTLLSLPLLSLATPISSPEAALEALEARADKWCTTNTSVNVNCRKGAGRGYDIVRKIKPTDRFGVRCKANGENISGTKVWDYIPGWGCWTSAYYTSSGCESMSFDFLLVESMLMFLVGGVPWCATN
jgi:hypothetical protein